MKKILSLSFILSILQSILFWHKSPGISVTIFLVATICSLYMIFKEKNIIKNKWGLLFAIPILFLGLTYFIFNNVFFQTLNKFVIFGLIILMCIKTTEGEILENTFIKKIFRCVFEPFSEFFDFIGDFHIRDIFKNEKDDKVKKYEQAKMIGKSLIIVIPIVLVIIALLASADSVFGNLFNGVSKLLRSILYADNLGDIIKRIISIICVFLYIFFFIIAIVKERDYDQKNEEKFKFNINKVTMKMMFISLNIIYFIFSIIQFKYLFMNAGKDANFDYATYARTGFFQLMIVSFINLVILKLSENQVDKNSKIQKVLLVLFTIIIVISAIFRMHLYEQAYGYTYLRLFVYFILITETLIMIPILINIITQKLNVFKYSLTITIIMYLILNFINIDNVIAKNNIDRFLADLENNDLDVYYIITNTGTDSIEQKLRILDIDTQKLSYERQNYVDDLKVTVKNNLEIYKKITENNKWQEWNLSRQKAFKLLK